MEEKRTTLATDLDSGCALEQQSTPLDLVAEFHRGAGAPVLPSPHAPSIDRRDLRAKLIQEECLEVLQAMEEGDVAHVAKELADLVYVTYGAALEWGIDLDAVFGEVHRSNMAKLGPRTRTREDGKIVKPEGWCPPDIHRVLAEQRSLSDRYRTSAD